MNDCGGGGGVPVRASERAKSYKVRRSKERRKWGKRERERKNKGGRKKERKGGDATPRLERKIDSSYHGRTTVFKLCKVDER